MKIGMKESILAGFRKGNESTRELSRRVMRHCGQAGVRNTVVAGKEVNTF
jgi:hypothetical protein